MNEELEEKILKEIRKLNLTPEEAKKILKQLQRPETVRKTVNHYYGTKHARIGVISDTHIGSKFFNYQAFEDSIKMFNKHKVEAIYHAGDVIEGHSNREGHIYELEKIGTSEQIKHAVDLLSQYKQPLYFITGNHDEWAKKKSNQGVIVGEELEERLKNAEWLGEYRADIKFADNVKMRLMHEGNTAYALSYSLQKRINAMEGGSKPDILFNGHLHKALYMFYRNIHAFEAGCLINQTPFMQMKGSPAHVGFWIVDLYYNKKGLNQIQTRFFPHY